MAVTPGAAPPPPRPSRRPPIKPARPQREHGEQHAPGDQVAHLRPEQPLRVRLDHAQRQPAEDGAGHRAQAPQHHGDQALGGRPHAEHGRDLVVGRGDQEAGHPADGRGQHERQHQHAPHRHADDLGRAPVVDDGADAEAEARAMQRPVEQSGCAAGHRQHQQMLGPEQERADRDRRALHQRGKRVEVARQQQGGRLLDLHPHREARDHGGDGGRCRRTGGSTAAPRRARPAPRRRSRSAPPAARRRRAAAKA